MITKCKFKNKHLKCNRELGHIGPVALIECPTPDFPAADPSIWATLAYRWGWRKWGGGY